MNRKTVVFLGAGASKALDLPLTNEIFPALLERLMPGPSADLLFRGDDDARTCLRECLTAFLPGLADFFDAPERLRTWDALLPPITDVLSTLDHALLTGISPSADVASPGIARARMLLERAVFELLVRDDPGALKMELVPDAVRSEWQETARREILPARRGGPADALAERTVDWLTGDLAPDPTDRVSVISTNYDIEVEQALYDRLGYEGVFHGVDFGTAVREPARGTVHRRPGDARYGIYKLHGSLNFLRCSLCGHIYVNPVGAIAYLSFLVGDTRPVNGDPWLTELWDSGANQCHCGHRPLRHVIVAPSYVRDVRDPVILEIWRGALEALRQADDWIIAGYSLPPEDVAIRSMLLRAYQGRDGDRPRVTVVQKARQEPELTRYGLLLPGHTYFPGDGEDGGLERYLAMRSRGSMDVGTR